MGHTESSENSHEVKLVWPLITSRVDLTCKSYNAPYTVIQETAHGNTISFLVSFLWHSMKSLSAKNLYGQLTTSMLFCTVIQGFSCFPWILFSTNNFLFLIYMVSRSSNVLKTSRTKGNARKHFPYTVVVVCPTLHHCRLYFFGMGFHKISFLILNNQKWT